MVSGGTVEAYDPSIYEKTVRGIKKVFRNKPAGNVGIGGYSTPIENVVSEKYLSESAKAQIAQNKRISNWTSGGSSGGGSSRRGGGGSSGGGGISAAEVERRRQAEIARIAELKRQQEEAKRLADKLQKTKDDKAASQTISGQVQQSQGPQPLTVSKYNPEDRYTQTPYRRSFGQSTIAVLGGLFADIGAGNLGSPGKYIDEYKYSEGIKRDVLLPDEITFTPNKIDVLVSKIKRGDISKTDSNKYTHLKSIITIDPIFTRKESEVTYGDIQRKIEDERNIKLTEISENFEAKATNITSSYQGKVDSGELTVEQATEKATKEFDVLNVEYKKEQEKIYKKSPDVPGVFERTGKTRKVVSLVPDVLATGTSIGVGLVNPVAGASIGLAYFGGKGILQGTQKPTYEEVGQQGGLYAGVTADEKGRLSITEPTQLDITYTGLRKEAGINLLIGAAYGGGLGGAYQKSYYTQALKDLGESPVVVKSVSFAKDKSSFDIIKGVQRSGQIERQITITGKVIKEGGNQFIMPSGQGYSSTAGKFAWGSKGVDPVYYAGGDVFRVGTKGVSKPFEGAFYSSNIGDFKVITPIKESYISYGRSVIEPQLSFGSIFKSSTDDIGKVIGSNIKIGGKSQSGFFAGTSEKIGQDIYGSKYYKTASGDATLIFKSVKGTQSIYDVEGVAAINNKMFGVQKVVKVGSNLIDDVSGLGGDSLFSFGRGTGTETVKGFGGTTTQTSLLEQSSKAIGAGQIKAITGSPMLKVGGVSISSQLINEQRSNGFTSISLIKEELKPAQNILTGRSVNVIKTSKQRGGLVTRQSQGLVTRQLPALSVAQFTGQIPRQKLKQRTIQRLVQQQTLIQPTPISPIFGGGQGFDFGFGIPFIKPKMAQFGISKGVRQKKKQRTVYQPSFTGSVLNLRISKPGISPGGLSLRGILPTKKKKFSIL